MKLKFLLFLICLVGGHTGCNDDDAANPGLVGTWNLAHVGGGLAGVDDSFGTKITWSFSPFGMLTVDNRNTDDTLTDILESGSYPYHIEIRDAGRVLFVEELSLGIITPGDGELVISNGYVDGFTITLTKQTTGEAM